MVIFIYPLVNQHSNGISLFSIGNTSSKGSFSIARLICQGVTSLKLTRPLKMDGWKINMEPENTGPPEKEKHLPNHHVQVLC